MFAGVAPGPVAPTPSVERSGPVVLVNPSVGCERYATVDGMGSHHVIVKWAGDIGITADGPLHLFDRATGKCIESAHGSMRGYQIHPSELHRFAAAGGPVNVDLSDPRVMFASHKGPGSARSDVFLGIGEVAPAPLPYVRHTPSASAEA